MRHLHAGKLAVRACLAALALAAVEAGAQEAERLRGAFEAADRNNDGLVNVDEYVAYFVEAFGRLDEDRDGKLALEDVPRVEPAEFEAADRDDDGMVSLGEAIGERMPLFFRLDENRDGVVSLDELMAAERRMTE